jgi:hypothetical protein
MDLEALQRRIDELSAFAAIEPGQNSSSFGLYLNSLPAERKQLLKAALAKAYERPLQKDATTSGITTATGLVPYSLQAPALNLWPVITPWRNRIPRVVMGATGFHWRRITAIDTDEDYGFVAENTDTTPNSTAGRAGFMKIKEEDDSIVFKTIGVDGYVTFEARYGGNTNTNSGMDFRVDEVQRLALLQAAMMRDEKAMIGANATVLGNVTGITKTGVTQLATGVGALSTGTAYDVQVTALTFLGLRKGSTGHASADAAGETGAAAATSISTTAGGNAGDKSLTIKWTAKVGAFAYNVYVGATGTGGKYLATCRSNYYSITATATSTNVPNTADQTADANGYDGIVKQLFTKAGYIKSLDGAALTARATNVAELDNAFLAQFNTYRTGFQEIWVSATDRQSITTIVAGSTAPALRVNLTDGANNITGGIRIGSVLNQYMNEDVPVLVHPYLPKGMIVLWNNNLGQYYPNANIPAPIEMRMSFDYLSLDWPTTSLRQEFGVYSKGAPTIRASFPFGLIYNVDNDAPTS